MYEVDPQFISRKTPHIIYAWQEALSKWLHTLKSVPNNVVAIYQFGTNWCYSCVLLNFTTLILEVEITIRYQMICSDMTWFKILVIKQDKKGMKKYKYEWHQTYGKYTLLWPPYNQKQESSHWKEIVLKFYLLENLVIFCQIS